MKLRRLTLLRPLPRSVFWVLIAAYLVLRVYLGLLPGYVNDIQQYKNWAAGTATYGVGTAYETTSVDYPPLMLFLLYAMGKTYLVLHPPQQPGVVHDTAWFTLLIKTPHLVFDLIVGALLYHLVARRRLWGAERAEPGWGRLAALLYLFSPPVLWVCAYWGQPDGVHSALVLLALAALCAGRYAGSGASLAAAGLMKPLAAPMLPLVLAVSALRGRLPGVAWTCVGGLAAGALVFLPFFFAGQGWPVVHRVFFVVSGLMPFTSVNGHNLWWIIGPWRSASSPLLGPLAPVHLGLLLFLVVCVLLLVRNARRLRVADEPADRTSARIFLLAAALTCSFFFFMTHMHENHLFMAFPLLLAVAGRRRGLAWLTLGCCVAVTVNSVLHDPWLPYVLPSFLGATSPVLDPHLLRPYTWVQVLVSFLDALLVGTVTLGTALAGWRDRI